MAWSSQNMVLALDLLSLNTFDVVDGDGYRLAFSFGEVVHWLIRILQKSKEASYLCVDGKIVNIESVEAKIHSESNLHLYVAI